MVMITVSAETHRLLLRKSRTGTPAETTTFNPDGTVTFPVDDNVHAALRRISSDMDEAVRKIAWMEKRALGETND